MNTVRADREPVERS